MAGQGIESEQWRLHHHPPLAQLGPEGVDKLHPLDHTPTTPILTWVNLFNSDRGSPFLPPPWWSGFWQANRWVSVLTWNDRFNSGTNTSPLWSSTALSPSNTDWEAKFIYGRRQRLSAALFFVTLTSSSRIQCPSFSALKKGPSLHENLIPLVPSTGRSEPNKSLISCNGELETM